jgi:hypothetical protein
MAAEAVLVHEFAPPHPRYTQLTQLVADVARRTQGTLTLAINPGGKVLYPGQALLESGLWFYTCFLIADKAVVRCAAGGRAQRMISLCTTPHRPRLEGAPY